MTCHIRTAPRHNESNRQMDPAAARRPGGWMGGNTRRRRENITRHTRTHPPARAHIQMYISVLESGQLIRARPPTARWDAAARRITVSSRTRSFPARAGSALPRRVQPQAREARRRRVIRHGAVRHVGRGQGRSDWGKRGGRNKHRTRETKKQRAMRRFFFRVVRSRRRAHPFLTTTRHAPRPLPPPTPLSRARTA